MAAKRGKADRKAAEAVNIRPEVARRLRLTRDAIEPVREEFARMMGLPARRWEQWERGATYIDHGWLAEFCSRWQVSADWILLGRIDTLPAGLVHILYERDAGRGELRDLIRPPPGSTSTQGGSWHPPEDPRPGNPHPEPFWRGMPGYRPASAKGSSGGENPGDRAPSPATCGGDSGAPGTSTPRRPPPPPPRRDHG